MESCPAVGTRHLIFAAAFDTNVHGVKLHHSQASSKEGLWASPKVPRGDIPRSGRQKGIKDIGAALVSGPCPYVCEHSTEVRSVECDRLHQRQKRDLDRKKLHSQEAQFHGSKFLGTRILRLHCGVGRRSDQEIHQGAGGRRHPVGTTQHDSSREAPFRGLMNKPLRGANRIMPPALPGVI